MKYEDLVEHAKSLSYRDKLRLAQVLIQLARREEETQGTQSHEKNGRNKGPSEDLVRYVAERLRKLQPSKKKSLINSINSMFQFQGGIAEQDVEKVFSELQRRGYIQVANGGQISYSAGW